MVRKSSEHIFLPYFIFFVISLLLLGGDKIGVSYFVRYPLEKVLVFPRRILYSARQNMITNLKLLLAQDLYQKAKQSDELKIELEVLKAKIQLLEEENKSLKVQLETPLPAQWDFIPAKVVGWERYLVIDKGKKDGVSSNMVVISENIVIGKVKAVSFKTSQVMLLWDPESKVPVKTDKNVKGLVIGAFGSEITLARVLQKDPLSSGDVVLTLGEEGFPADLVIGKVEEVSTKKEDVYKEARVLPLIDYDKLENVFVVSSY